MQMNCPKHQQQKINKINKEEEEEKLCRYYSHLCKQDMDMDKQLKTLIVKNLKLLQFS